MTKGQEIILIKPWHVFFQLVCYIFFYTYWLFSIVWKNYQLFKVHTC